MTAGLQGRTVAEYLTDEVVLASVPQSDAVLARTVSCYVDTLGVALAAAGTGAGTAAAACAAATAPAGPCLVWGYGTQSVALADALMANGMLAHALDFDDTHAAAIMHSSCMIVPATLALAQQYGTTGRRLLESAIAGYEVAGRLGRLAPGNFQDHGFQATAVLGVFACVAVAARFLALSRVQVVNAFGIAGSMASGLMEYLADGSSIKQLHPGWAAHGGVRAAQLAAYGLTGPHTVFEGRFGAFRAFAHADLNPEGVVREARDELEVGFMGPKPYPCCLCVHALIQAAITLRTRLQQMGRHLEQVRTIHCGVPAWYVPLVCEPLTRKARPATDYEAKFSAPYCVARALLDGEIGLQSFTRAARTDATVLALAARVAYQVEDLAEFPAAFPARLTVVLDDGVEVGTYVGHNLGSPGAPFRTEDYDRKFLTIVTPYVGAALAAKLLAGIRALAEDEGPRRLDAVLREVVIG